MGALLEQAMEMQQQLMDAQAEAAEAVVEGQAGGGRGQVRVTGAMVFQSVTIAPEAVDPDDVEMLQDLVLAALHDAIAQIAQLQQSSMGGLDLGRHGRRARPGPLGGDSSDDEDDELTTRTTTAARREHLRRRRSRTSSTSSAGCPAWAPSRRSASPSTC